MIFTQLHPLSAALFYEFVFWVCPKSVENLQLLSQHNRLRQYILRAVFVRVIFDEYLVYMSAFHMNVDQDLAQALRAATLRGKIEPDDVNVGEAGNMDWFRDLDLLDTPCGPQLFMMRQRISGFSSVLSNNSTC